MSSTRKARRSQDSQEIFRRFVSGITANRRFILPFRDIEITEISVENFKGFKSHCRIPIRPVTLFFGANNGGKSSILKLFSSIEQTRITRESTGSQDTWLPRGVWFDLGEARQIINKHRFEEEGLNQFKIGIGVRIARLPPREELDKFISNNDDITPHVRRILESYYHTSHIEWELMLRETGNWEVSNVKIGSDSDGDGTIRNHAEFFSFEAFEKLSGLGKHALKVIFGNNSRVPNNMLIGIPGDVDADEFCRAVRGFHKESMNAKRARERLLDGIAEVYAKHNKNFFEEISSLARTLGVDIHISGNDAFGDPRGNIWGTLGVDGIVLMAHILISREDNESPKSVLNRIVNDSKEEFRTTLEEDYAEELRRYKTREEVDKFLGAVEALDDNYLILDTKYIRFIENEEITKVVSGVLEDYVPGHAYQQAQSSDEVVHLFDFMPDMSKVLGSEYYAIERAVERHSVEGLAEGLRLLELSEKLYFPFVKSRLPIGYYAMVAASNGLNIRRPRWVDYEINNWNNDEEVEDSYAEWLDIVNNNLSKFRTHLFGGGVDYLGATRLKPQRYYKVSNLGERGGISGERTISALAADRSLLDFVNEKLKFLLGLEIFIEKTRSRFGETIDTRLYEVRVGKSRKDAILHLPDVGFGISQILPLLTSISSKKTLVIEEPESNLHPRAQANLIQDILLSNREESRGGGNVLMETHSEHFLIRILQLLEEGEIDDEDVSLVFVSTTEEEGTMAKRIRTKDGALIDEIPESFLHLGNHTNSLI